MKSKAFNLFLLLLLSGAHITKAQNKVYGIVQINDKSFSNNDVFIYDGNNKFLTTPDEKGYYEFFTEKKKMNIVYLLVGSQFIQKDAKITNETEVNIIFEKQTKILFSFEIINSADGGWFFFKIIFPSSSFSEFIKVIFFLLLT